MTTVHIRARIHLNESVVLFTEGEPHYKPLSWTLPNGVVVTVGLDVRVEDIRKFAEGSQAISWVNSRVDNLYITVRIDRLDDDSLSRLKGTHPTAAHYTGDGKDYQEAVEFGQRVAQDLVDAANDVIRVMRAEFGQHWLTPLKIGDSLQHFLLDAKAEWSLEGDEQWSRLWATPPSTSTTVDMGIGDHYLQERDWEAVGDQIARGVAPTTGFTLVADSLQKYHSGDLQTAVIHLNSALEWGVERFIELHLGPVLPPESLKALLKQTHGRLLDDWVLPLGRKLGIDLETKEWPTVKKIQKLRREAGHPSLRTELLAVDDNAFFSLTRDAVSALSKMLGISKPKMPPPFGAGMAGGTDGGPARKARIE